MTDNALESLYSLSPDELRERLLGHVGTSTWPPVHEAVAFAEERHAGRMRRGEVEEPETAHLLRTALILWEVAEQRDANVIAAGVLHDVLEDTDTTLDEVEDRFGPRVGDLVRALTVPERREGESAVERNARYFETLRWEGRDAHVVKSADRLDNLRTMAGAFSELGAKAYLEETREKLLPLTLASNTALYHALTAALERAEAAAG